MSDGVQRSPWHWVVAGAITVAVAGAGALLTQLGPWYFGLAKPSWQPPDWLFGPAWTLIFLLATISAVYGWRALRDARGRRLMVAFFLLNALCNMLWSLLFFTLHRPDLALLEVPALWASVLALIVLLWPRSRAAAVLLVPYLLWVSFAAFLNYTIVQLNPLSRAGG
jgi:tryptophan-rich sensory protein